MILTMDPAVADGYSSRSQIARVITESWGSVHLYCAACPSECLSRMRTNSPASDYVCCNCGARYQLKSASRWNDRRVVDAGYSAMIKAIQDGKTPNLVFLQYDTNWLVVNLLLVPALFFVPSIIEKRKPLGQEARRAGWIGCNILLSAIPPEGRIRVVHNRIITPAGSVRENYDATKPLSSLKLEARGWTLEVLSAARSIGTVEFSLEEVYAREPRFRELYPANRFIRPKIRQQLQVLRNIGYIEFLGGGRYRFLR